MGTMCLSGVQVLGFNVAALSRARICQRGWVLIFMLKVLIVILPTSMSPSTSMPPSRRGHGWFLMLMGSPLMLEISPKMGMVFFSYAVGCSPCAIRAYPYANLAFPYAPPAPPRSPPAPPFSPKPGFSLCSPVAACAAIAPSLPHLPISNETEPSMYQNATKYSRAKYYMYYSIAYQNRNITSQQNTTYHNIMPRSRWDGRAGFPLSWGFGFI